MIPLVPRLNSRNSVINFLMVWGSIFCSNFCFGQSSDGFARLVERDGAIGYWRFEKSSSDDFTVPNIASQGNPELKLQPVRKGGVSLPGPRSPEFPLFDQENQGIRLRSAMDSYRIKDSGAESGLEFDLNDSITLEAWVEPSPELGRAMPYLIGKGRLTAQESNQNYAMRLVPVGENYGVGFLFRSRGPKAGWHRWTATKGFSAGDGWHHVAVTYTFGKADSLKAYIDGVSVPGKWDMDGATSAAPVVDQADVSIGTCMGQSPSATYLGGLDELAIYRQALSPEQIREHFRYVRPKFEFLKNDIPETGVVVNIYEGVSDKKSWDFRPPKFLETFHAPSFGFIDLPVKYSDQAIRVDRANPSLLRAAGRVVIPAGEHRILVRSRNSARLSLDGELLLETPFHNFGGDNSPVLPVDRSLAPHIHPLHRGDQEVVVNVTGDGKSHLLLLETIIGGGGRRPELGETGVYLATPQGDFRLLGTEETYLLTDADWARFEQDEYQRLQLVNDQRRRDVGQAAAKHWEERHAWAKSVVEKNAAPPIPVVDAKWQGNNWIDRFIGTKLQAEKIDPAPVVDDLTFLRRVTLDTTGRMPTPPEQAQFLSDPADTRRTQAIDRLLASPEWADHWIGYWQDVLAENPNIINPTLNNTGPFRFWIEESFRDNKPLDRFVTELIMMEGSLYFGGPAGFSMASQNDAPMAAKAHILGEAFLGVQMKCARCHDAVFHDVKQQDLFAISAMLNRGTVKLPVTSTVPGGSNSFIIQISLKPGDEIEAKWPFSKLSDEAPLKDRLKNSDDSRKRLALLLTSPYNQRFAPVFVNRLWHRYLGQGFVEKDEDWEHAEPSHPELLEALSHEFVVHGYDIKHLARVIFQSEAYQRKNTGQDAAQDQIPYLFASPIQRRLTAEQIVDSMFRVAEKDFDADVMAIDIDTGRSYKLSLNLGRPRRSWQFASLSNERDRPSLSLPYAQPFITALENFGWRSSRQDPVTERDTAPNPLQPGQMENGLLTRRICTLSDDSGFTRLALQDQTLENFVNEIYHRILTRAPTADEKQAFLELLSPGFDSRRVAGAVPVPRERVVRTRVAWTNHLHPDATRVKQEMEKEVRRGDPPTVLLEKSWRERAEDMIWVLINSPEFMFTP